MASRKPYANIEDERITHECRFISKSTRLSLTDIGAMSQSERDALWQQWGLTTKRQFVALLFERASQDWTEADLDQMIATIDARVNVALSSSELADDHTQRSWRSTPSSCPMWQTA